MTIIPQTKRKMQISLRSAMNRKPLKQNTERECDMPSEKTKRAQCIIARYQKEIQIDDDRNEYYCSLYAPRKYGNEK